MTWDAMQGLADPPKLVKRLAEGHPTPKEMNLDFNQQVIAIAILAHGERQRGKVTRLGTPLIPWQNVEAWARRLVTVGPETRREQLLLLDAFNMTKQINADLIEAGVLP